MINYLYTVLLINYKLLKFTKRNISNFLRPVNSRNILLSAVTCFFIYINLSVKYSNKVSLCFHRGLLNTLLPSAFRFEHRVSILRQQLRVDGSRLL